MKDEILASLFGHLATQARDTVQAVFRLIELEARHSPGSDQGVYLDACKNSADCLLRTIDDTRSLFTDRVPARVMEEFDLARCLTDTVELLNLSLADASRRLHLELPDGPRLVMHTDREAVEQVLTRVLAAAVKLTPAGVVRVHFEPGPGGASIAIRPPQAGVGWRVCRLLTADLAQARFTNNLLLEVNGMVAGNRLRALGGTAQLEEGPDGVEGLCIFLPLPSQEGAAGAPCYELARVLLPQEWRAPVMAQRRSNWSPGGASMSSLWIFTCRGWTAIR